MCNFKVGQRVVFVDEFKMRLCPIEKALGVIMPIKNKVYTIREIDFVDGDFGLRLIEIINPKLRYDYGKDYGEICFSASRFRPLDEQFADEIEAYIKEKVKEESLVNI